jgi:hypothetical protein
MVDNWAVTMAEEKADSTAFLKAALRVVSKAVSMVGNWESSKAAHSARNWAALTAYSKAVMTAGHSA